MDRYGGPFGRLLVLLVLTTVSCVGVDESAIVEGPDREVDETAIRSVLAANEAATNRRDSRGVAETFTADADLLVANGPRIVGVAEIQRNEEEFYSTPGFQEWRATIESIRFVADDVAIVEQIATTTLERGETHDYATVLMSRQDEGWKIAAVRVLGQLQP